MGTLRLRVFEATMAGEQLRWVTVRREYVVTKTNISCRLFGNTVHKLVWLLLLHGECTWKQIIAEFN